MLRKCEIGSQTQKSRGFLLSLLGGRLLVEHNNCGLVSIDPRAAHRL